MSNTRKGLAVRFNLLNHTKPDSLFNHGMLVAVFSERLSLAEGRGWQRAGRDISYFQNNFKKVRLGSITVKDTLGRSRYHYTLTFTYEFPHD